MVLEVTYGLGFAAFVILLILAVINRRPQGVGLFAVVVFATTAVWALSGVLQTWWMPGLTHTLESVRSGMWLQFLASVMMLAEKRGQQRISLRYRAIIPAVGVASFVNDLRFLFSTASPIDFDMSQVYGRVLVAIIGLLLVEQVFRNTVSGRRWHMFPLCLAAGSLFAYDLFVFAEAALMQSVDVTLLSVRGIVLLLIVPALVLTMARNEDWRVDIHVSRKVVFHTATLTVGGIFLVLSGGAASLLGRIPGEWGVVFKIAFFCGSMLVLATVVSTETLRARFLRLIGENFFSRRYDYREEWLRIVDTISAPHELDPLRTRVIQAVANIVDSPAGALWLEDRGNYSVVSSWNFSTAGGERERGDSPFIALFEGGKRVLDIEALRSGKVALPEWLNTGSPAWLAVPLMQKGAAVGFIVLAPPRAKFVLNWESFELLLTIGRQVASYLIEERSTRALVDAEAIIEYNKRFAFIVHDVKNLSSQLGMMVSNIRRYSDDPEFRSDMIKTLENSVSRLNGLLDKLRSDGISAKSRELIDPALMIKTVAKELEQSGIPIETDALENRTRVRMDYHDMYSVLTHLVTNAIEASPRGSAVSIRLRVGSGRTTIDVEDKGPGMDVGFIRNELFVPRRSRKSKGHGIGAFQARETLRSAGGDLQVISALGFGTIMRITLPGAGTTHGEGTSELALGSGVV